MSMTDKESRVDSYVSMLEERVQDWLGSDEASTMPCAELYVHLPNLFRLLAGLVLDGRVPERERKALMSGIKYIVAPFDLIPEGVVGPSGYRDDLVLAAVVVERLESRLPGDVVEEHWPFDGDPFAIARTVLDAGETMVGPELCERLRSWVPTS